MSEENGTSAKVEASSKGATSFELLSKVPVPAPEARGVAKLVNTFLDKPVLQTVAKIEPQKAEVKAKEPVQALSRPSETNSSSPSSPAGVEEAQKPSTPAILPKVHKAKAGEKEIEIPEDAVFTVRVDGKDVQVKYGELAKEYSGKTAWDKRFKETKDLEASVLAEKKAFETERSTLNDKFKDVLTTFEQNPFLAFEKIAKLIPGTDRRKYLPIYIAQAKKTVEELEQLSEAELKALLIQKGAEYDKETIKEKEEALNARTQKMEADKQAQEDDQYLGGLRTQHNISEEEIARAVKHLQGTPGLNLKEKTLRELIDITVDYVVNVDRKYTRIESVASEFESEIKSRFTIDGTFDTETFKNFMFEVGRLVGPEQTLDDIKEIIAGYLGKDLKQTETPQPKAEESIEAVDSEDQKESPKEKPSKAPQKATQKKSKAKVEVDDEEPIGPWNFKNWVSSVSK